MTENDLHCTVYSTTAIESLSLGVPTILYNLEGQSKQYLPQLMENEFVYFIESGAELIKLVEGFKVPSKAAVIKSNEYNIVQDYKSNVKSLLKSFLGDQVK